MGSDPPPIPFGSAWRFTHRYRWQLRLLLAPVSWRTRVSGAEVLGRRGPFIVACNHSSLLDGLFVWLALSGPAYGGPVSGFVMDELMGWPVFGRVVSNLGFVPVERDSAASGLQALLRAKQQIEWAQEHEASLAFMVFPEASTSRDEHALLPLRPGAAWLSVTCGVPIVPAGVVGTARLLNPNHNIPNPFARAQLTFGSALDPAVLGQDTLLVQKALLSELSKLSIRQPGGTVRQYGHRREVTP